MKRLLGILVLGFILSSCGAPNTSYQGYKDYYSEYKYHAYACPASDPDVHVGCGLMASDDSQRHANEEALRVCRNSFSDCVVIKEGNVTVYSKQNAEKVQMADMIEDSKNTCKSLGFREGTEKFSDCSLKLYTQKMELAAKQNQQVIVQGSSSGSMTIYDPVRDSGNMMRRGMGLINGTCTIASYLNC